MTLQLLLTNSKKSLTEVAKIAGVGHVILYQIRNGEKDWNTLSVKNYDNICKALNVSPFQQHRRDAKNV